MPQPQTIEEVFLSAVQLLPEGWGIEIILKKDLLLISCVNPKGDDEEYNHDVETTAGLVTNALAQACYLDIKQGMEAIGELEP